MKYEVDSYTLEYLEDEDKYYIYFEDSVKKQCSIEIDKEVFDAYIISKKAYKKISNEKTRHIERLKLSEEELYERSFYKDDSTEDKAINNIENKKLHDAMKEQLTETQYRRVDLHIINKITIRKLAELENVNKSKIENSLNLARKKLKKIFEQRGGQN